MAASLRPPTVVRVSQKGQATIPKMLREEFGIEAPGEVFVYTEDGRLIIEPVPTFEELHGIHAGDHEPGDVLAKVRAEKGRERQRETERVERLRPRGENKAE